MGWCEYETYPNLQSEKEGKKDTGNYYPVNITSSHNNYTLYIYVYVCSRRVMISGTISGLGFKETNHAGTMAFLTEL